MARTPKDIVRMEVHYCVSSLVSTLAQAESLAGGTLEPRDLATLTEQAFELAAPIEDWEEPAREAGWTWDEAAEEFRQSDQGDDYNAFHKANPDDETRWVDLCESEGIDPHQREVYEHWIVSDWLADKLEALGEKVDRDFAGLTVWARTTTGQAIYADSVVEKIAADLNAGA